MNAGQLEGTRRKLLNNHYWVVHAHAVEPDDVLMPDPQLQVCFSKEAYPETFTVAMTTIDAKPVIRIHVGTIAQRLHRNLRSTVETGGQLAFVDVTKFAVAKPVTELNLQRSATQLEATSLHLSQYLFLVKRPLLAHQSPSYRHATDAYGRTLCSVVRN